ncbi:MAG TPA: glycosyltransferase family 2 protein [Polyangiaceae bacterium]|nr:glycosyltransferase family 2 protein [Polyangiaceae bacterium]
MLSERRIAVVIPAYREARLIRRTLAGLPGFVDAIYVVDDASPDATGDEATASGDPRLRLIRHAKNQGVGAAIVTGYRAALIEQADVVAVMGGDAQMDPDELESVLTPVLAGQADYVKGNRFRSAERRNMPWTRRLAGRVLSALTRLASGLNVGDCQCGYTAIGRQALYALPLAELWPRFGYPNDLLLLASRFRLRVKEVTVRPVYADEDSGVRAWHALLILWLIVRRSWEASRWASRRLDLQPR